MKVKVLIADDHELLRKGIRMLLETDPAIRVVGEAASGRVALDLAKEHQPDVVVMDICMPEMNGIDAIQQLQAEVAKTKAIALTGNPSTEFVSRALGAGAKGYLIKDSAVEELIEAVHVVAGGSVYLTPKISSLIAKDYENRSTQGSLGKAAVSLREREVLQLISEGRNTKEIAAILEVSIKTVESHRTNLMKKLDCQSVAELVRYSIRLGISPL